jgi:hypothetical protein
MVDGTFGVKSKGKLLSGAVGRQKRARSAQSAGLRPVAYKESSTPWLLPPHSALKKSQPKKFLNKKVVNASKI